MYIDIIISLILISFIISGYSLGFFVQFISLFGFIGNFFVASYLTPLVIDALRSYYKGATYTKGYLIIFFILYILLMVITKYINIIFKGQNKGQLNRVSGVILSLIKGIVVCMLLIAAYNTSAKIYPKLKKYSKDSMFIHKYNEVEEHISDYIPKELKDKIESIKENEAVEKYIKKIL